MSTSHIKSNLALRNRVCSVPEGGILFPFDDGLHGIDSAGNIIYPEEGAVATLRPGEGRFDGAVAVEEGTTNLCPHPTFKNWRDGWNGWDVSTLTIQKENIFGIETNVVNLIAAANGTTNALHYKFSGYVVGLPHTLSLYARINPRSSRTAATLRMYITAYESKTITREWQRFSITQNATATSHTIHLTQGNSDADIQIAFVQVEQKSFATSFIEGSRGGGQLNYITPLSLLNSGTVRFLVNSSRAMADHDNYSTGGLVQILHGSVRQLDGWMREQGISIVVNDSAKKYVSYEKNKWYDIAYTWENGGNPKFYFNGVLEYDDAETFTDHGSGLIRFGTYSNSYINSVLFDEITILPYAATPEQIQAWYHSNAPMHNNADTYITL